MATDPTIEFAGHHLPSLQSKAYTITASQVVQSVGVDTIPSETFPAQTRHIYVGGPRFGLDAGAVVGVFPPAGSLGDHSNVLPHILIEPSTTPWERDSMLTQPGQSTATRQSIRATPWLALLVFDAAEAPDPTIVTVGELATSVADFPVPVHEPGGSDEDKVTVIDLPQALLLRLLPEPGELAYLAHVRIYPAADPGAPARETAVVLANRLPASGSSVVHLVSLEHRIRQPAGNPAGPWSYDAEQLAPTATVRLVSLYHWSFACIGRQHTFHGLLEHLDRTPPILVLPDTLPGGLPPAQVRVSVDDAGEVFAVGPDGPVPFGRAGAVAVTLDPPFGAAMAFDANDQGYVAVPDPFTDRRAFTVSAWVRPDRLDDGAYHAIVGRQQGAFRKPSLWLAPSAGALHYDSYDPDGNRYDDLLAGFFTAAGRWTHLTWVKDGTEYRFYRDGALFATRPAPDEVYSSDWELFVGWVDNGWVGQLCDVRVYAQALSADQVAAVPLLDRAAQPELTAHLTRRGMVPLGHDLRTGAATVSWYHGPLQGGDFHPGPHAIAEHPDGLLEYFSDLGMLDVSYAAAFELGRRLMLRETTQARALHRWKRELRRYAHRTAQQRRDDHLYDADDLPPMPDGLGTFFEHLALLGGVPLRYLVPDERLLPPESLRFVRLEEAWVAQLLAGAASVGGPLTGTAASLFPLPRPLAGPVTGVLLRSELVSSWPELVLTGYPTAHPDAGAITETPAIAVRPTRLSDGIVLCLFHAEIATLDINLAPEQIHFGFREDDDGAGSVVLTKPLRSASGAPAGTVVAVPLRPAPGSAPPQAGSPQGGRTIDVLALAARLTAALRPAGSIPAPPLEVADFALEMVQGVPRGRFVAPPRS